MDACLRDVWRASVAGVSATARLLPPSSLLLLTTTPPPPATLLSPPQLVYQGEALVDLLVRCRGHHYLEFKAVEGG